MVGEKTKTGGTVDGAGGGGLLPVVAVVAATLFWGASFSAMRVTVPVLGPWAVMWLRMATALLLLVPFAGKLWSAAYRKGDWKFLLPMALFQPCLYFSLESNALRFTTSSQAGVIAASVPLMVALGAWLVKGIAAMEKVVERFGLTREIERIIGGNGHPPEALRQKVGSMVSDQGLKEPDE